jgi:hypothetical protein
MKIAKIQIPYGGKPPHGNLQRTMLVTGFLLAAYFAIENPECRKEFIITVPIIAQALTKTGEEESENKKK